MIVLASASASRKAMLEAAGVAFEARPADVDEAAIRRELVAVPPAQIAMILAEAKALAGSAAAPGRLVLGSDSLVEVCGRIFSKPRNRDEAVEHLRMFSGQPMRLHSAAVLMRDCACVWRHGDMATLQVRTLTEEFIADYLAAEWPEVGYCAGVFRIEGRGVQLFESVAGSHFTVLGMPLLPLLGALREHEEIAA